MQRHTVLLGLVPILLLAGCLGTLAPGTGPADSTDVSPEEVPGVASGTLSNASALVEANQKAVTTDGAILRINQSSDRLDIDARVVVGANLSTVSLSGTSTSSDGISTTIDQWSNETTQIIRTSSEEGMNYRVRERHDDRLSTLSTVEEFVSVGNFEVANETAGEGTVVLTADSASTASDSMTIESFDARLVVDASGQIQNLSVTVSADGETATYRYELRQAGVESAPMPDWVDEVPPGATVQAQLSVDVENDSYLAIRHTGGDTVPSGTTVQVESNGTTDTATLESALSEGETRYAYFEAPLTSLRLRTERPEESAVSSVTSPVSVRIATEGGAVLHSGSMAWDSEHASEGGGDRSSESATSEGTDETATPSGSKEN